LKHDFIKMKKLEELITIIDYTIGYYEDTLYKYIKFIIDNAVETQHSCLKSI
jgi:hypothetical protein